MSLDLIAVFVIVGAIGMLIGYTLGYSAGRKTGFKEGHKDGRKEGSVKAYAVGYDRGRHDREAQKKEEEESSDGSAFPFGRIGCSIYLCLLWVPLITMLVRVITNRF